MLRQILSDPLNKLNNLRHIKIHQTHLSESSIRTIIIRKTNEERDIFIKKYQYLLHKVTNSIEHRIKTSSHKQINHVSEKSLVNIKQIRNTKMDSD